MFAFAFPGRGRGNHQTEFLFAHGQHLHISTLALNNELKGIGNKQVNIPAKYKFNYRYGMMIS